MNSLPFDSSARRPVRRGLVGLVLAALLAAGCSATPDGSEGMLRADSAAVDAVIAARRALVKADAFFLELDPVVGTLTLMRGASPLRSWPVLEIEGGARRVLFGRGESVETWRQAAWSSGALLPQRRVERTVLVAAVGAPPPDPSGSVDFIPPLPEEAVPAPRNFTIRFDDGLGLRIVSVGEAAGPKPGLGYRHLAERLAAGLPWRRDRYRIELSMAASEAGALYRALPDAIPLIAVLPDA